MRADAPNLVEVVHDIDGVEPPALGRSGQRHDLLEKSIIRHTGIREVGNLEPEKSHRLTSSVL